MTYRTAAVAFASFIVLGCGWLLAEDKPAASTPPSPKRHRFEVVTAGNNVLLLDAVEGKSWMLRNPNDAKAGWALLPFLKAEEVPAQTTQAAVDLPVILPDEPKELPSPVTPMPLSLDRMLTQQGYTKVKLRNLNSGYIAITVKISGKDTNMIVDTGAPNTHVDPERTAQARLEWKANVTAAAMKAFNANPPANLATAKLIEVGNCRIENLLIGERKMADINLALAAYNDPPVDGILGGDILKPHLAIIDYRKSVLYLLDRSSAD